MTKKHFEAIAQTLNENLAPLYLVLDFADMLAEDNPRFNRAMFVQAATARLEASMEHDKQMLDAARA